MKCLFLLSFYKGEVSNASSWMSLLWSALWIHSPERHVFLLILSIAVHWRTLQTFPFQISTGSINQTKDGKWWHLASEVSLEAQLISGYRWLSIKQPIITHIKMSGLIRTEAKNNIFCWCSLTTTKGIPLQLYSTNMQYVQNNGRVKGILPNRILNKAMVHCFD